MKVQKIERIAGAAFVLDQCEYSRANLDPGTIGYPGYREKRAKLKGRNPDTCMKQAKWIVDNKRLCTGHGGLVVLEAMSKESA